MYRLILLMNAYAFFEWKSFFFAFFFNCGYRAAPCESYKRKNERLWYEKMIRCVQCNDSWRIIGILCGKVFVWWQIEMNFIGQSVERQMMMMILQCLQWIQMYANVWNSITINRACCVAMKMNFHYYFSRRFPLKAWVGNNTLQTITTESLNLNTDTWNVLKLYTCTIHTFIESSILLSNFFNILFLACPIRGIYRARLSRPLELIHSMGTKHLSTLCFLSFELVTFGSSIVK